MLTFLSLVTFSVVTAVSAALGPRADLHIINGDIAPDGFTRSYVKSVFRLYGDTEAIPAFLRAILASGTMADATFPGALITAKKGDHMKINVMNSLHDTTMLTSTSIHWHGFFQKGSTWADGPAGVTQCPILSGNSFLYEFSVGNQAGTFWYHSHLSTQYCDGLRGPIVVYDPDDPFRHLYDVDDGSFQNTVITLADWYHTPAPSAGLVPTPDATLINGLGRSVNGDATPLAEINVVQGKRYRFRLVSISCDPNYIFSIDGHNMTIIEVDGVNHKPLTVDSIQIFAGQRYSVIVAAVQPVDNYWVRAQPNTGVVAFDGGLNSAILRYQGAAIADPGSSSTLSNPMLQTNLHPLTKPGAPGGNHPADVSYVLDIQFATGQFTVNNASFTTPTMPVLLQIMSGAYSATDLLPQGSVYVLPKNKIIELTIPGGAVGSPHTFDVVRSAGSTIYNYDNPVRRDVVSTGVAGDNVTIRFRTDNPGPWFLHCHIDWHLEIGLAIAFAEDVPTIAKTKQPPSWHELCPLYNNNGTLTNE
ncbi:hypothetical protein C0993_003831 [Termitomyces sp. T159_Od127]|nr:hypothetical protein C0993_003831 [Termitomyces sp. T159_Od127]